MNQIIRKAGKMVLYLLLAAIWSHVALADLQESKGDYMGCFQHHPSDIIVPDLSLTINGTLAAQTVDNCLAACLEHYFRYAGIWNGQFCLCGSSYGSQGAGDCNQNCYGNRSQLCGSLQAISVYATGHLVPGPPTTLTHNQTGEFRINVYWDVPKAPNGNVSDYMISAEVTETYSTQPLSTRSWTYPSNAHRAGLLGLFPATQYNLSLAAVNQFGPGRPTFLFVWTHIKEPSQPESPEVVKEDQETITVRLKPVINDYGPISAYRVVVSSEPGIYFADKYLKAWNESQKEELPYYITAELPPEDVTNGSQFVVGDGKYYGKQREYYNAPLKADRKFFVSLGAVSNFRGLSKASYSSSTHSHPGVILLEVPEGEGEPMDQSDGLTVFLKSAIVVCALLLVLAIMVYAFIHKKYGGRRYQRRDQQELNIRGAVTEVENSAFVYDEYLPEEEERRVDYYDMLHQKIWNIPRNFLDIQSEMIGEGSFGPVFRGSVQQHGKVTPVAIYAIQDGDLGSEEKRNMLEGIDAVMRGGEHAHILSLTGTCESQDTLYVVLEHHPALLKDVLLQSRSLQHSQHNKTRFCSLSEASVFDFIIGVAQGMSFLSSKKIIHKQLTSSNVLMADGLTPKICGFGIGQYNRRNGKQDFSRWWAQEVLSKRVHTIKSDIWSFGVLMWEVCALGGTPYGEVASDVVAAGVMRGMRLTQLSYLGDSLYQLMLQCWQIDLDERPTFPQICAELDNIKSSPEFNMELSFNTFRDFQYEPYSASLEYY